MVKYNCRGLNIPLLGKWCAELWFCPPKTTIPAHIHPDVDSHIVHIWGKAVVMKEDKMKMLPYFTFFSIFHILRGVKHGFVGCKSWFIFLNVEKWHIPKQKSIALNLKEV